MDPGIIKGSAGGTNILGLRWHKNEAKSSVLRNNFYFVLIFSGEIAGKNGQNKHFSNILIRDENLNLT